MPTRLPSVQTPGYSLDNFGLYLPDSFVNFMSGLGVQGRDKQTAMQYGFNCLSKQQLEVAFRGHWLPRKIVSIPAYDVTREWRQWTGTDNQITAIQAFEKQFSIQRKVRQAMIKARLYGGAAMILGVNDGRGMEEELNFEAIRKDSVQFIHVVSRYDVGAGRVIRDITSPYFGQPEYYDRANPFEVYGSEMGGVYGGANTATMRQVQQSGMSLLHLHPSRVIRFVGAEYPDMDTAPDPWGDSILQVVDDAIKDAGAVSGSLAQMINEAKLDIINIPGLTNMLSTVPGTKKLTTRFSTANAYKSVFNGVLLDKEETWQRQELTWAGMPEVMQVFLLLASGAADIPSTRLYGRAPAGENATGESDTQNYYDRLAGEQETDIRPTIAPLDEIIIRASLGSRPANVDYTWNPLWQLSDETKATLAFKKAQAFQIDVAAALIPPEVLREGRMNQLVQDEVYPGLDQAQDDYDAGLLEPIEEDKPDDGSGDDPAGGEEDQFGGSGGPDNDNNSGGNSGGHEVAVNVKFKKASTNAKKKAARDALAINDATPRPLYVRRDLLNKSDVAQWAKGVGYKSLIKDPHVTLLYSKTPVDPMTMGRDYNSGEAVVVPAGGPRVVEPLGSDGATVLHFAHAPFNRRHDDMIAKGASHDYPQYQPHMTLTYQGGDVDCSKIEPYNGPLVFGPEVFAPINNEDAATRFNDYSPDQPRDEHGMWSAGGSGGGGGGGSGLSHAPKLLAIRPGRGFKSYARVCTRTFKSSAARAVVGHEVKKFTTEHAAGILHHETLQKLIVPAVTSVVALGCAHLGLGEVSSVVAETVAGYATYELVQKFGFTHEKTKELLSRVGHALLSARDHIEAGLAKVDERMFGGAHGPDFTMALHGDALNDARIFGPMPPMPKGAADPFAALRKFVDAIDALDVDRLTGQ